MELFIFHNAGFSLCVLPPLPSFIRRVDPEVQRETKKIVCCPEPTVAYICEVSCSAHAEEQF